MVGSEGLVKYREKRRQWIESGLNQAFSNKLIEIYHGARDHIADAHLEVWNTEHGDELVIGDCPAFTVSADGERYGLDAGVTLNEAATIVMPLGPKYTCGTRTCWTANWPLPSVLAEKFNLIQCQRARKQVVCRPESGLDQWVVQRYREEDRE